MGVRQGHRNSSSSRAGASPKNRGVFLTAADGTRREIFPEKGEFTIPLTQEPLAAAVPAASSYTDPHHFDTNPDDYVLSGEMPSEERLYRFWNRRPEFQEFVSNLRHATDAEVDLHDWSQDESCEPLFIEDPAGKRQEVEERAAKHGFTVEWGDDDYEGNLGKLWVYDPVVEAVMPKDFNPYTLRNPQAVSERAAAQQAESPFTEVELERALDYQRMNAHELKDLKRRPTAEETARYLRENPEEAEDFDQLLRDIEAEEDYERRTAFGEGATIVNVFTGKQHTVGRKH